MVSHRTQQGWETPVTTELIFYFTSCSNTESGYLKKKRRDPIGPKTAFFHWKAGFRGGSERRINYWIEFCSCISWGKLWQDASFHGKNETTSYGCRSFTSTCRGGLRWGIQLDNQKKILLKSKWRNMSCLGFKLKLFAEIDTFHNS